MKLIFFDFDGVLVDTLMMHYGISKEVNKDMPLDFFRSLSNGNIFRSIQDNPDYVPHPQFFERYEAESRELIVPTSIADLVRKLREHYTLAIISSTPTALITKILKQTGLHDCFADILGSDLHTSKVVKIKMLLEKYKVAGADTVFITDTVGDIKEGRECGVKSIAVTWGFQGQETLQKADPDKIVSTPEDLAKAVEEIL